MCLINPSQVNKWYVHELKVQRGRSSHLKAALYSSGVIFHILFHFIHISFDAVNMYWTASADHVVFCDASLSPGWLACMDVQTRWCYMDVETRNICFCDHHQKMWFKYYTECIPFWIYVVSRQLPPIANDFEENGEEKIVTWADPILWFSYWGNWHNKPTTLCFDVLVIIIHSHKSSHPTFLWEQRDSITPVLASVKSKSSLYIFLWGNEPLTF